MPILSCDMATTAKRMQAMGMAENMAPPCWRLKPKVVS